MLLKDKATILGVSYDYILCFEMLTTFSHFVLEGFSF